MYTYVAYGLGIHSDLPLPELWTVTAIQPDITIRLGRVNRPLPMSQGKTGHCLTSDVAYFYWETVGAFLARAGREVLVDPAPGAAASLVRLPLLGMVLAAALHQRGVLALHASAVAVGDQAVAILGLKGQGKSTLAAALYARGHRLVTDDLLALDFAPHPMTLPGFPQLKLCPEAAVAALGDEIRQLTPLAPGFEKYGRRVERGFEATPLPLVRGYFLSFGDMLSSTLLPPQTALLELIAQSYVARVFGRALNGARAANHFLQCADLAQRVPFYRLTRPLALDDLSAAAAMIETA